MEVMGEDLYMFRMWSRFCNLCFVLVFMIILMITLVFVMSAADLFCAPAMKWIRYLVYHRPRRWTGRRWKGHGRWKRRFSFTKAELVQWTDALEFVGVSANDDWAIKRRAVSVSVRIIRSEPLDASV